MNREININFCNLFVEFYKFYVTVEVMKHRLQSMEHNASIGCTVSECKFHCKSDNYCTLEKIEVVKHEHGATTPECTDCGSFELS